MQIRIHTPAGVLAGIYEGAREVCASEYFDTPGRCVLRIPAGDTDRFPVGSLVCIPGIEDVFIVESRERDEEAGEIGGRGALSFFERRVVTEEVTHQGNAATLLLGLAQAWGTAVLPGGLVVEDSTSAEEITVAVGHQSLLSAMREIAALVGVGLRLRLTPEGGWIFSLRHRKNSGVHLSESLGNLRDIRRTEDYGAYINRVHVFGNGGHLVTLGAAGLFGDGVDDAAQPLREAWEDASELAISRFETAAQYREALTARGKQILARHRPLCSVTAEVDEATASRLSIGDICPLRGTSIRAASAFCAGREVEWDGDTARVRAVIRI